MGERTPGCKYRIEFDKAVDTDIAAIEDRLKELLA